MKRILIVSLVALAVVSCVGRNREKKSTQAQDPAGQTATVPDTHNSRNSLDYEGTYTGIFPCADCPGIEVRITIDRKGNFTRTMAYLERPDIFTSKGTFEWDFTGGIITLNDGDESIMFRVGENTLTMLDREGNAITGELADKFILRKEP